MTARTLLLPFLGLLTTTALLAATGRLRVEATDEKGEPLAGTRVVVTVKATERSFELEADRRGRGVFQGLPSGEVIVRFEHDGFQIYETNALIQAGATPEVEAKLQRRPAATLSEEDIAAREAVEVYNRAVGKYRGEDLEGARVDLERALEIDPELAAAHLLSGHLATKRGDPSAAADAYLSAYELEPSPGLLPRLIQALELAGRSEEAARYLALAGESEAASDPTELYNLAIVKINQGDDAGAGELLDRLLTASPDHAPAFYQRALIHLQSGEVEEARACFERYLELAPAGELAADVRSMLQALG